MSIDELTAPHVSAAEKQESLAVMLARQAGAGLAPRPLPSMSGVYAACEAQGLFLVPLARHRFRIFPRSPAKRADALFEGWTWEALVYLANRPQINNAGV